MFVAQLNKYFIPATEEGGAVGSFLKQMHGHAVLFFQTSQLYCQLPIRQFVYHISVLLLNVLKGEPVIRSLTAGKAKTWMFHTIRAGKTILTVAFCRHVVIRINNCSAISLSWREITASWGVMGDNSPWCSATWVRLCGWVEGTGSNCR